MQKAAPRRSTSSAFRALFQIVGLSLALTACGGGSAGGGGGEPLPVDPPAAPPVEPPEVPKFNGLQDFQAASVVIGQGDFASSQPNRGNTAPDGTTLSNPAGVAVSEDGRVFVTDIDNRRVLAFAGIPDVLDVSARFAIGQPDLVQNGASGREGYTGPSAVSIGAGKMAVVDRSRHRVLIYDAVPTGSASPAVVVGQADLDAFDQTCDRQTLSSPRAVQITPDGKLLVADTNHSRVLIWNRVPDVDGAPADIVLGQADFFVCDQNSGSGVGRGTMSRPEGVWSDGQRVAVADTENHRVLLWDELLADERGQLPVRALGQLDFGSALQSAPAADTLLLPRGLAFNGTHLAVVDFGQNRVLLWPEWPTQDFAQAATTVIGQRDMSTVETAVTSSQTLGGPSAVAFHQDKLLVVDRDNHRVLIFKSH